MKGKILNNTLYLSIQRLIGKTVLWVYSCFVGVTQGDHEFVLVIYYNRLLLTFTISFTGRLGLPAATSGTLVQQRNFRDTLTYAGTFVLHVMIWGKQIHVWRLIQLYIAHYICSQLTFLDKEFLFAYCMFYFHIECFAWRLSWEMMMKQNGHTNHEVILVHIDMHIDITE